MNSTAIGPFDTQSFSSYMQQIIKDPSLEGSELANKASSISEVMRIDNSFEHLKKISRLFHLNALPEQSLENLVCGACYDDKIYLVFRCLSKFEGRIHEFRVFNSKLNCVLVKSLQMVWKLFYNPEIEGDDFLQLCKNAKYTGFDWIVYRSRGSL